MNTTSNETGPRQPRKEKRLVILGALWGAIGGGLFGGIIFWLPSLFMALEFKWLFVIIGVAIGVVQGAGFGPLAALRFSRGFGKSPGDLSSKPL